MSYKNTIYPRRFYIDRFTDRQTGSIYTALQIDRHALNRHRGSIIDRFTDRQTGFR